MAHLKELLVTGSTKFLGNVYFTYPINYTNDMTLYKNLYLAGGNTYYISDTGSAKFNTLNVTGAVTLSSTLNVTGAITGSLSGNASSASKVYGTVNNNTGFFYVPFHTGASSENKSLQNNSNFGYYQSAGTTSATGMAYIMLGNSTTSGTAGNSRGYIRLYSASNGYVDLASASTTGNYTVTLPAASGTVALTSSNISGNAATATKTYGTVTNPSSGTTYYVPFHTNTSSENKSLLNNNGLKYYTYEGTTSTVGISEINLGNSIASDTAGNKRGQICLYGSSTGYTCIVTGNNTTSNVTITLPSSTGTLALTSSSITGNAATATKLATARTIALAGSITGSGTFDGSGNLSISTMRKSCCVGQSSSTNTNPYYKFASFTCTGTYIDSSITFKVFRGYGDVSSATGILTAHFRTSGTVGSWESGQLVWEYADSGLDPSKFFLCYKATSGTSVDVQLYVCVDVAYAHYHFDVLSEGDRVSNKTHWTLYNADSAGQSASLPSGYTSITSTFSKIANGISGNADTATLWNGYTQDIATLNSSDTWLLVANGTKIQHRLATDFATSGHTHNYAGSSSAGGSATSAVKTYSTLTNPSSGTTYYIPFHAGASSDNKSLLNNNGLRYYTSGGTTSANGVSELALGNGTASGTAGNKFGRLTLYGTSTGYTYIVPGNNTTSNYTITLPAASGTLSLNGHTHSYIPLSGGTVTGNIVSKTTKVGLEFGVSASGACYIYSSGVDTTAQTDALGNLTLSSWQGVSFTTSCTGQTCTGITAVGINCRTGDLYVKGDITCQGTTFTSLKNSVSDGKTNVANAITAKGVSTSTTATFATMKTNISSIRRGERLNISTSTTISSGDYGTVNNYYHWYEIYGTTSIRKVIGHSNVYYASSAATTVKFTSRAFKYSEGLRYIEFIGWIYKASGSYAIIRFGLCNSSNTSYIHTDINMVGTTTYAMPDMTGDAVGRLSFKFEKNSYTSGETVTYNDLAFTVDTTFTASASTLYPYISIIPGGSLQTSSGNNKVEYSLLGISYFTS